MLNLESVLLEIIKNKKGILTDSLISGTFVINAPPKSGKSSIVLKVSKENASKDNGITMLTSAMRSTNNYEAESLYKDNIDESREYFKEELTCLWNEEKNNNNCIFILDDFCDWRWFVKEIRSKGWVCPVIVVGTLDETELQDNYTLFDKKQIDKSILKEYPVSRRKGKEGLWYIDLNCSMMAELNPV